MHFIFGRRRNRNEIVLYTINRTIQVQRIDNDDSLSDRAGRVSINGHERFESIDHSQIKHREYRVGT